MTAGPTEQEVGRSFNDELHRRRLRFRPSRGQQRQSPWAMMGIGAIFAAIGVGVAVFALTGRAGDAPRVILVAFGGLFAVAGAAAAVAGVRRLGAERRLAAQAEAHPGEPWMRDHAWSPHEAGDLTMRRAGYLLGGGVVGVLFGSFFAGMGVSIVLGGAPWFAWLFALIGAVVAGVSLASLGWGLLLVYRRLRFGRTRVRYERFPLWTDEPIELAWVCPSIGRASRLTFTLRYIREEIHITHSKNGPSESWEIYERYTDGYTVEDPGGLPAGEPVPVTFLLPPGARGTHLASREPRYWELEVHAKLLGPDFRGRYLLPIYERSGGGAG